MNQSISEIQKSLDICILNECVSKIINKKVNKIKEWSLEAISCASLNFTTDSIFRIYGTVIVSEKEIPWSLVLKIIKPEQEEKNNPQHHNYWRREALVNQTGVLTELPEVIYAPQCYKVEEKENSSVWIWMEEIKEDNKRLWSENEFAFAARQLGIFNGTYITEKIIIDYSWICRKWLKSWVNGCKKHSIDPTIYYSKVQNLSNLNSIYNSYVYLNKNLDKHFNALNNLPRVLAHQDLSKQNMYINVNEGAEKQLTLIDWQFLSISGLGEDLGKLYGVALSQQDIPIEKMDDYKELLFTNYLSGLREVGWNGDATLPKYGFYASFAIRSAWEVPKLFKLTADSVHKSEKDKIQAIEILTRITSMQMELGKEAEEFMNFRAFGQISSDQDSYSTGALAP